MPRGNADRADAVAGSREPCARHRGWSDTDAAYLELGAQTKRQVVKLLPDGWAWEGKRVLDFGSSAGRTLRHFAREAAMAAEG